MQIIALIKMLPYIGMAGIALTALFFFLRGKVLEKRNRALTAKIEGLSAKLANQEAYISMVKKNLEAAKQHTERMVNNKEVSEKIMEDIKNAKNVNEILNTINNSIKLHNKN